MSHFSLKTGHKNGTKVDGTSRARDREMGHMSRPVSRPVFMSHVPFRPTARSKATLA